MTRNPELRAPSASIAVERQAPQPFDPRAVNAPGIATTTVAPLPVTPEIPAQSDVAEIATVPLAAPVGSDQAQAAASGILPELPRGTAGDTPSMSFLPAGTSLLDDAMPATQYEFGGLPLIGVYR